MKPKIYKGLLSLRTWGDAEDILYLSTLKDPLVEELKWMARKRVSVRYWITDKPCSINEASVAAMMTAMGDADVNLQSFYSEITGYLWTDEDLVVGGHDLLEELKSSAGKWLILEVRVIAARSPPPSDPPTPS